MSSSLDELLAALPTADDVGRWEELSARLGQEIRDLTERKRRVDELIARAKLIFGPVEASPSDDDRQTIASVKAKHSGRVAKGVWTTAMLEIAESNPDGISYEDIRAQLPEGLKEQVAKGNMKAFYGSLARLEEAGKVVRFNSHVFTPRGFRRFEQTGEYAVLAQQGGAKRGSPMGEAIKAYLAEHGPSKGVAIRDFLIQNPEFRGPIKRNSSALYNVLKRLADRNELTHDRENSLYGLAKENEAPSGDATGASETGEAATSPIESRSSLRLIG